MQIRIIEHGSPEYLQTMQLRIDTLLHPIGIPASYIVPEHEKKDVLIGAFEAQQIIGCCVLTEKDPHTVQLRQMAVRVHRQGSGIGARILSFAEQVSKEKGYRLLMMHARAVVCPFYQKCGYQVNGPEFFEVGIPHYMMQKRIEP